PRGIELARGLSDELEIPATFVLSDLYDLPGALSGEFDVVYTSRGVLGWLPDVEGWARVAARFVKPGGFFYLTEVHPFLQVFEDEGEVDFERPVLRYPYWSHSEPIVTAVRGSYADPSAEVTSPPEFWWNHWL